MPKTNVLFILSDDQGPWAAGCYGNPEIRTPNLDRLAATGTRFQDFFVATPVCSPSRATLLTGRVPSQHGVFDFLTGVNVGPDAVRFLEGEVAYTDIMAWHGTAGPVVCRASGTWAIARFRSMASPTGSHTKGEVADTTTPRWSATASWSTSRAT